MHFELRLAPLAGSGLLWGCSGPALGSSGVLWPPLACSGLLWGSGWLTLFPGGGPELGMLTFLIRIKLKTKHGELRLASRLSGRRARARNAYFFN